MLLRIVRDIILFIFIFSAINDNFMVDYLGDSSLKAIFIIFVVINLPDIFKSAMHPPENVVMRSYYIFILMFTLSSLITVIFFNRDILQEVMMPIVTIHVVFTYFSHYKSFDKLLYMIWGNVFISSIISLFNEPISIDTFRTSGGTIDPVEFCIHLFMGIFITIYLFNKNKNYIFLIPSLLLFSYALLLTGSKTALLTLALLMLLVLVLRFGHIFKYIFSFKGLVSLAVIVTIIIQTNMIDKISSMKGMQERAQSQGTFYTRLASWEAGYGMIQDNFFIGVGLNEYAKYTKRYLKAHLDHGFGPHNIFVKMFAEAGVFSFLTFLVFLFFLFKTKFFEIYKSDYLWISLIPMSAIFMGLGLSVTFEKHFWLTFALWANIILLYSNHAYTKKEIE